MCVYCILYLQSPFKTYHAYETKIFGTRTCIHEKINFEIKTQTL